MRLRAWVIVFVVVQVLGVACSWFWNHPTSAGSSLLWGTALVVLFPGNIVGAWLIEALLWKSRLSLPTMGFISTVLTVAINAVVWWLAVKGIQAIHARLGSRSNVQTRPSRS
jgi:hypothetical protein